MQTHYVIKFIFFLFLLHTTLWAFHHLLTLCVLKALSRCDSDYLLELTVLVPM